MAETITAIYENGVLRPLEPLDLAEHTQVQVHVLPSNIPGDMTTTDGDEHRKRIDDILRQAGMLAEPKEGPSPPPLSSAERLALARRVASAGPLSEVIIEEREGR